MPFQGAGVAEDGGHRGDRTHSLFKREAGAVKAPRKAWAGEFKGQAGRGFAALLGGLGGVTVALGSQKQLAFWDSTSLQGSMETS